MTRSTENEVLIWILIIMVFYIIVAPIWIHNRPEPPESYPEPVDYLADLPEATEQDVKDALSWHTGDLSPY
jgi:hypothetical protein